MSSMCVMRIQLAFCGLAREKPRPPERVSVMKLSQCFPRLWLGRQFPGPVIGSGRLAPTPGGASPRRGAGVGGRRSPRGGGHADRTPCAGGQHAPQAVARMTAGAARGEADEASAQTRSHRVCAGRHEAARPQNCAPNQCRLDTVEGGAVRRDGPRWASERDLSRSISWAVGFRTRLLRKRAARSSVGLMVNGVPGVLGSLRRGLSKSGGGLLLSARGVPPRAGTTCRYRSSGGFSRERAGPTAWLEEGDLAKARSCLMPFCAAGWPWEPD